MAIAKGPWPIFSTTLCIMLAFTNRTITEVNIKDMAVLHGNWASHNQRLDQLSKSSRQTQHKYTTCSISFVGCCSMRVRIQASLHLFVTVCAVAHVRGHVRTQRHVCMSALEAQPTTYKYRFLQRTSRKARERTCRAACSDHDVIN
jgi:hypothetical protein